MKKMHNAIMSQLNFETFLPSDTSKTADALRTVTDALKNWLSGESLKDGDVGRLQQETRNACDKLVELVHTDIEAREIAFDVISNLHSLLVLHQAQAPDIDCSTLTPENVQSTYTEWMNEHFTSDEGVTADSPTTSLSKAIELLQVCTECLSGYQADVDDLMATIDLLEDGDVDAQVADLINAHDCSDSIRFDECMNALRIVMIRKKHGFTPRMLSHLLRRKTDGDSDEDNEPTDDQWTLMTEVMVRDTVLQSLCVNLLSKETNEAFTKQCLSIKNYISRNYRDFTDPEKICELVISILRSGTEREIDITSLSERLRAAFGVD